MKILLAAAVVSFGLSFYEGESFFQAMVEPSVILVILIINAIVGVWQEASAENALERLKQMQPSHAHVRRHTQGKAGSSSWTKILAVNLVPGDIVRVSVGDSVPSDCRLIHLETATLKADEGALTGESKACSKTADSIPEQHREDDATKVVGLDNHEKHNIIFASTNIVSGKGHAVVVGTGKQTQMGLLFETMMESRKEQEDEKTPLGEKIDEFGQQLTKAIGLICLLVWLMNFNKFFNEEGSVDAGKVIYYLKVRGSITA